MRLAEGPRYVINRIAFKGNTITRDDVIRRELNLYEGGVFNTAALKNSVRRLNQLGYFKALEGTDKDLNVAKANGVADAVDLTFTLEEQNRNQIQFGGGVSQYDGAFFNLAYTTTNLLGRGESMTVTGQRGTRSSIYQVAFTEPYAFNRPITAGAELYSRKVNLLTSANTIGYSEVRAGGNLTFGRQLFPFARAFATYGYEVVDTAVSEDLRESLGDDAASRLTSLFLDDGRHIESRITPSFVYNTVDNPYTPRSGRRLSINMPIAGGILGGTTSYIRPEAEAILYFPHTRRTALGVRLNAGLLRPYGGTTQLPVLPALRHGRRVPDPRRRAALGRTARRRPARDRRRQVRAVQRGVLPRRVRPGARAGVPRRRPGLRRAQPDQPAAAADVDRRRAARDRADAQRPVPPDLRLEHLSRRVPAGAGPEVRRWYDVLAASPRTRSTPAVGTGGVCTGRAVFDCEDPLMTRLIARARFAVLLSALAAVGCQSPTDPSDTVRYDEAVDIAGVPDPISADTQTSGRTYRIVRGNNQPDEIMPYDWHAVFSANITLNSNANDDDLDIDYPVRVVATTLTVKQATGGIVTPPTGSESEKFEFVTLSASGNQFAGINTPITLGFEVWYDLPSLRKEAIVQVAASFVDDDGTSFQKTVDIKVAP